MKKILSIMLAACLLLGALPFAASAAETVTLKATKTDVKADGVTNYGGYGSLHISGNESTHPQAALMDKTGKLLFPYRETCNLFYYSDGVVSLTSSTPNRLVADQTAHPNSWNLDNGPLFFDITGKPLTFSTAEYSHSGPMIDGHAVVFSDYDFYGRTVKASIIDKQGNQTCILNDGFNEIITVSSIGLDTKNSMGWFGEGLAAYYENPREGRGEVLGYMDSTGKTVIDLSDRGYTNAWPFHDGLAMVYRIDSGEYAYIDKAGNEVIPGGKYYLGTQFYNGIAAAGSYDRGWVSFDKTGTIIGELPEMPVEIGDDGIILYKAPPNYAESQLVEYYTFGLMDVNGNILISDEEYDDVSTFLDGVAYAIKDGYVYIITKDEAPAKPTVGGFSDVYEGDYYADAVVWAVENDVTSGVGSGKFAPGNNCTREQIVTFLWRANGSPRAEDYRQPLHRCGAEQLRL